MSEETTETSDDSELTTGLFNLFAKFTLSVDKLTAAIERQRVSEQRRMAVLPRNVPILRMSQPGAATTDVQSFGGPQPGREWVVRLLTAFATPVAANAAVVTWYVGQNMGGAAAGQLPSGMGRWQFPSVPGFQNFTSDVIVVRFGEQLIAGLTTIPAASSIALTAVVDDQPAFAERYRVAVE
jgi:hypothetical protein